MTSFRIWLCVLFYGLVTHAEAGFRETVTINGASYRAKVDSRPLDQHLKAMSAKPHSENGKFLGLKLTQIKKDSIWEALKLRDDDIFCGIGSGDGKDAQTFNVQLIEFGLGTKRSQPQEFCLIRGGRSGIIDYRFQYDESASPEKKVDASSTGIKLPKRTWEEEAKVMLGISYPAVPADFSKTVECEARWQDKSGPEKIMKFSAPLHPNACSVYCTMKLDADKLRGGIRKCFQGGKSVEVGEIM